MSDFDGGFILERVDAGIAPIVYEVTRAYLLRHGEPVEGRAVAYAVERGAKAAAVEVTGGPSDGKGRTFWPQQHVALAGELAKALGCRAWAWGRENQVGSESVTGFSPEGAQLFDRHLDLDEDESEDDASGPVDTLAAELGGWPAAEGSSWVTQPLDAPLHASLLSDHVAGFDLPPATRAAGATTVSVFLAQCLLVDAKKLAVAAKTDLGTVLAAAWESAKAELAQSMPAANGDRLAFPASPLSLAPTIAVGKEPPALSDNRRATPDLVPFDVPKGVARQMRELAVHADVQYGIVVDRAYQVSRERLWRGGGGR